MLNIEARQDIPELLTTNHFPGPWSYPSATKQWKLGVSFKSSNPVSMR